MSNLKEQILENLIKKSIIERKEEYNKLIANDTLDTIILHKILWIKDEISNLKDLLESANDILEELENN